MSSPNNTNSPSRKNIFSYSSSTSSSYFSSSFSADGRTQTRSYGETTYTDPAGHTTVHRVLKEPGMTARREDVEYDHLNRKIRSSGQQGDAVGNVRRIEDVTDKEEEGQQGKKEGEGK